MRRKIATLAVHEYADEDYPTWALAHPSETCPGQLVDITASPRVEPDPWGTSYAMYCGQTAPAPAIAFGAASFGEDRREGTGDDIRSWE